MSCIKTISKPFPNANSEGNFEHALPPLPSCDPLESVHSLGQVGHLPNKQINNFLKEETSIARLMFVLKII
jgi:hypothetical protein